jgi:hypothetical protein
VIAGIVLLSRVAFQTARPPLESLPDGRPGSGIVTRVEVTTIWLPKGLFELAQRPADHAVIASHEELQTHLDRQGLATAWYAMTTRGYQLNGAAAEITFIRRPGESPEHFEEYQAVMATAAGRPPDHPGLDFSRARVVAFADSLLNADPREVVAEMTTQADRSRQSLVEADVGLTLISGFLPWSTMVHGIGSHCGRVGLAWPKLKPDCYPFARPGERP